MNLEEAIEKARMLDWRAQESWPFGFSSAAVAKEAKEILDVIDNSELLVPPGMRQAWARGVVERLAHRAYRATVAPRRRKIESGRT